MSDDLTQEQIAEVFAAGFLASTPTPTPEVDSEIQRLIDKADADEAFILSQVHNSDDPGAVNNDGSIGEPWPSGPKPADQKVEEFAESLIKGDPAVLIPAELVPFATFEPESEHVEQAVEADQSEDPK